MNLPVFLKHPGSATVNISTNVTFSCTAKGFSIIDVVWRKVGSSRLPLATTIITKWSWSSSEVTSNITFIKVVGYHMGKYYCTAMNEAGETSSKQADLLVQGYYSWLHISITYVRTYM